MFIIGQIWKPFKYTSIEWISTLLLPYTEIYTAMIIFEATTICNNMYKSHKCNNQQEKIRNKKNLHDSIYIKLNNWKSYSKMIKVRMVVTFDGDKD